MIDDPHTDDPLIIAGEALHSRLFLGTAGYPNQRVLETPIQASGCHGTGTDRRNSPANGLTEKGHR